MEAETVLEDLSGLDLSPEATRALLLALHQVATRTGEEHTWALAMRAIRKAELAAGIGLTYSRVERRRTERAVAAEQSSGGSATP